LKTKPPILQEAEKRDKWNYTVREIAPCELEFAYQLLDWSRNIERVGEKRALYWLAGIFEGEEDCRPKGIPSQGLEPSPSSKS
jgi:hypothetical protein